MFTGIISECGRMVRSESRESGRRIVVEAPKTAGRVAVGASVAVNGCCLTVTEILESQLGFDLLEESVRLTNFGDLRPEGFVNLETAVAAQDAMGGHFVSGHIDHVGRVEDVELRGEDRILTISFDARFSGYLVYKGSIAVNGVSLTVAEDLSTAFKVWLIPHTLKETNLSALDAGDRVNLEFDMLAKYVEKNLRLRSDVLK